MTFSKTVLIAALATIAGYGLHAAETAAKTQRYPIFDNTEVKVWRTVIEPNQPLSFHRHENRRIVVPLTDTKLKVVMKDSKKVDLRDWKRGSAYWYGPDPVGELHGDVNESDHAMEVVVIEFQKPQ